MASRTKKLRSVPFDPTGVATKASPYVQRVIQDATLRENVQKAVESTRSAYERLTNGKAPAKALMEDKKLQRDLRQAYEAAREASIALSQGPKKRRRRGFGLGRLLLLLGIGGGVAVAVNEKLRSKVLDTLFGAEEEFEYTPPATTTPPAPAEPVSST
jgi:ferric-dicitrate binding protein FerR (iron transport regulator)